MTSSSRLGEGFNSLPPTRGQVQGHSHHVLGALAAGKTYLLKRQLEVIQDIACHEAEMGRLAAEKAVLETMQTALRPGGASAAASSILQPPKAKS